MKTIDKQILHIITISNFRIPSCELCDYKCSQMNCFSMESFSECVNHYLENHNL